MPLRSSGHSIYLKSLEERLLLRRQLIRVHGQLHLLQLLILLLLVLHLQPPLIHLQAAHLPLQLLILLPPGLHLLLLHTHLQAVHLPLQLLILLLLVHPLLQAERPLLQLPILLLSMRPRQLLLTPQPVQDLPPWPLIPHKTQHLSHKRHPQFALLQRGQLPSLLLEDLRLPLLRQWPSTPVRDPRRLPLLHILLRKAHLPWFPTQATGQPHQ